MARGTCRGLPRNGRWSMRPPRFPRRPAVRPWSTPLVVLPIALTVVVTGALAWSAWDARREHRRAAEEVARDYASLAADLAADRVEAALEQVLLYAFYGADLADRAESSDPVPPEVLATNPAEAGRCESRYPEGRWFLRVGPSGASEASGTLDSEMERWVVDTLVALQASPGMVRRGNLFPDHPATPVVAYRIRRDTAGASIEAHALAHCFESREGSVFDEATERSGLLLSALAPVPASRLTLVVTDPLGRAVFGSSDPASSVFGTGAGTGDGGPSGEAFFTGVRPPDATGPLEGLVFSLSVPMDLADDVVAGGIPPDNSMTPWLLVILAGCLGAATLAQLQRSLALTRTRERFVANVSHELRTPLQLVLLFAQLARMERTGSPGARKEALEVIERETQRLIQLVERLLTFAGRSRSNGGTDVPEQTSVDVAQEIRDTIETFRPVAAAEQVRICVDLPDKLPILRARPDSVRQILLNLLDNAVRHGPKGQDIFVRVSLPEGAVELRVDDEGPGIPPEEREAVWEAFHRLDRSDASGKGGSGIGLAVVRETARDLGGHVWIDDPPGSTNGNPGTRVVVRLPVHGGEAP